MNTECFDVEVDGTIAHLILNRPAKRNSMIPAFWRELPALIEQVQRDGRTRVIVISARGPHFSSGMDLSLLAPDRMTRVVTGDMASDAGRQQTMDEDRGAGHSAGSRDARTAAQQSLQRAMRFRQLVADLQSAFSSLERARVPVLVAIQGGCIGGAMDMVSAADIRYATTDAHFIIHETNLGMTADVGTFPRLCKLMPDGLIRELAYTGRVMTAQEALQSGFVTRLFDNSAELLAGVMQVATQIADKAPLAVHGCKQMILHARDHTVSDTLEQVSLWNAAFFSQQEVLEAFQATSDDRKADFTELPPLRSLDDDIVLP